MKIFANHSKGFVNLTFVFILMAFVSLYLMATFAIALSQQRDYVRSACIQEATALQISTLKNVRSLFALNIQSTVIRHGIKITKAAIVVAEASGQFQLIPGLQIILKNHYKSQNALDVIQKALVKKAQFELQVRHAALVVKVISGQREQASSWRYMLSMSSFFIARSDPELAIRPDSEGGVGPNYEWQENAESKLKLAYSWNMFFTTSDRYQRFFTWTNVLSLQCSVAPNLRGKKWVLTINGDK